tara:strand:+ start:142 stop:534 length:393 start_codon:yes stop_codon:yes gene_type:complete
MGAEEISPTVSSRSTSATPTVNQSQVTSPVQERSGSEPQNMDTYVASAPKNDLALYGKNGKQFGSAGQVSGNAGAVEVNAQRLDYELETNQLDAKRVAYEVQTEQIYGDRVRYETQVALMDSVRIRQEES